MVHIVFGTDNLQEHLYRKAPREIYKWNNKYNSKINTINLYSEEVSSNTKSSFD